MRRGAELAGIALAVAVAAAVAQADEPTALLEQQRHAAATAHTMVEEKRVEAEATRAKRVRAAYKLLRGAGSPLGVTPERRMAVARSRATARLLLARDRAEAAQLAGETALLAGAVGRIERDLASAATAPRPADGSLLRPVTGEVVRRFGTLAHEATRATLSRRGIDFDVADEAVVVAPADGIVRYAGPIRGLESGLVIDHGGVLTVIAKLAPPTLTAGTKVSRGAPLGHAARRRVYLEVRLPIGPGGTPVDPEPLLQ